MTAIDRATAKLTLAVLQGVMSVGLFIFGITILIVSALTLVKSSSYPGTVTSVGTTGTTSNQTGSIILIFAGLIQSLFALMGVVGGAVSLSKKLFYYSLIILSIHCAALFVSGFLSVAGSMLSLGRYDSIRSDTQDAIAQLLSFSPGLMLLGNSGDNQVVTGFLHHLQTSRQCCGWFRPSDVQPGQLLGNYFDLSSSDVYPGTCCGLRPSQECTQSEVLGINGCFASLQGLFDRCNLYSGETVSCINPNIFTVSSFLYASGILGMIQSLVSLLFFIVTLIHLISLVELRPNKAEIQF